MIPADYAFRAEPDEVLTTLRPRTERAPTSAEEVRERNVARVERRLAALPATGPATIKVTVAGASIVLSPSDRPAAIAFDALRVALGVRWDAKRGDYVAELDEVLRHGAAGFDAVLSICAMGGLKLEITPGSERLIAAYQRHLKRQLRPIPRAVWRDEDAPDRAGREVVSERDLKAKPGWKRR